jgi:hypothetical protein
MFWRTKEATRKGGMMNKAERAQIYSDYLRGEGYLPSIDQDGDVKFKKEGGIYYIMFSEEDAEFFRLVFPNFWSIETTEERAKVEKAALHATAGTKVAKVFPVKDNVWATIELFCSPPECFKPVFPRSMSALRAAVETFAEKMREQ